MTYTAGQQLNPYIHSQHTHFASITSSSFSVRISEEATCEEWILSWVYWCTPVTLAVKRQDDHRNVKVIGVNSKQVTSIWTNGLFFENRVFN